MGRPRKTVPKYSVDKNGRAFTKVDGKFISLGRADSPDSKLRYAALLSDVAQGKSFARRREPTTGQGFLVSELCVRFLTDYAYQRYTKVDGTPNDEVRCFKCVIRILTDLFAMTPANEFQALRLRTVRQKMIEKGWARKWINKQVARVRLMFRVAVSWEMVRPDVLASLQSVPPLSVGESSAPETEPRTAIPDADLEAVRQVLQERHRDVLDLLMLTGARPGELINLTTGMIDRDDDIWRANLRHHKTAKKGKTRTLYFVPSAQLILRKYLKANPNERMFPFQRQEFSETIKRACERANVKPFTPHGCRHTVATRLADEMGIEAAQRLLGHSEAAMTQHYSKGAEKQAIAAAKSLG